MIMLRHTSVELEKLWKQNLLHGGMENAAIGKTGWHGLRLTRLVEALLEEEGEFVFVGEKLTL